MRATRSSLRFAYARLAVASLLGILLIPNWTPLQAAPLPVAAARVESAPIVEEIPLTGSVTSSRTALLSPAVSGQVLQIHAEIGDRVEAGAPLLSLDPELATLELESAAAEAREAATALTDARRRRDEARRLEASQGIAETEVRSLEAEVRMKEATLARLQAHQNHQQAVLERHEVKAPFAGVISQRLAETGEWIDPGMAVYELTALDDLLMEFQVPQAFYPRIDLNTPVSLQLAHNPTSRSVPARVAAIVPVNNPNSRTFLLRVASEQATGHLTPGMAVQCVLYLAKGNGLTIPTDALLRHPDGRQTVWLVNRATRQPTAAERVVRIGVAFAGRLEVLEGLRAGDEVITRGNELLQQGQPLELIELIEQPHNPP